MTKFLPLVLLTVFPQSGFADDLDWGFSPKQAEKIKQLETRLSTVEKLVLPPVPPAKPMASSLPAKAIEQPAFARSVPGSKLTIGGVPHTANADGIFEVDRLARPTFYTPVRSLLYNSTGIVVGGCSGGQCPNR